jgi:hypothetical protein
MAEAYQQDRETVEDAAATSQRIFKESNSLKRADLSPV